MIKKQFTVDPKYLCFTNQISSETNKTIDSDCRRGKADLDSLLTKFNQVIMKRSKHKEGFFQIESIINFYMIILDA